jgi:DNA repair protein RadC
MSRQGDLFAPGVAEAEASAFAPAVALPAGRAFELDALDEVGLLDLILQRVRPAATPSVAQALLAAFGGLGRVFGANHADLARVAGPGVADDLCLLHALVLRTLAEPLHRREVLTSWAAVKTYLSARLRACPREAFHVLFLDKKNQLIADERVGEGTVDHAPVYPREVMRRALELSATALVLAHNHPSGDPSPSKADIEMTRQVVAAGKALQIAVHDHLIVGANEVVSFRALGLI